MLVLDLSLNRLRYLTQRVGYSAKLGVAGSSSLLSSFLLSFFVISSCFGLNAGLIAGWTGGMNRTRSLGSLQREREGERKKKRERERVSVSMVVCLLLEETFMVNGSQHSKSPFGVLFPHFLGDPDASSVSNKIQPLGPEFSWIERSPLTSEIGTPCASA